MGSPVKREKRMTKKQKLMGGDQSRSFLSTRIGSTHTLALQVLELLKERGNVDNDTGTDDGGAVLVDQTYWRKKKMSTKNRTPSTTF